MRFSPVTLGQQVKRLEVEGFVLTETKHPPSLVIPRHAHERASLSFVLRGSFVETLNQGPKECLPFNLIIKPAGEVHADRYGTRGAQSLIMEVKPESYERVRAFSKVLDYSTLLQSHELSMLAMRVYREFQTTDAASPLAIEGLILEMLAEASRPGRRLADMAARTPGWLRQAVELMREDYAREGLTLSSIAAEVGVHPAHLARTFRQVYRSTVGDYIRRLRVERAARELIRSGHSLAEIAMLSGFYDQSHLTHAFRLYMKTTPAAFRAAFKSRKAATKRRPASKT